MNQSAMHSVQDSMNQKLINIAELLPLSELVGDPDAHIARLQMDSRSVKSGDLFLALKGERFDAHDFLVDIGKVGGVCAIVNKSAKPIVEKLNINAVCVDDTKLALGELAKAWRHIHPVPLIAVTGSNGKTTVTQMIASILHIYAGEKALATQGNLNNDIGLPQTVLRLRGTHTCAVVELGMNHPGEIEYLAKIASADVGLINNAQREHQEFMSTVEAVAIENGQIISALRESGVAVFPADDQFTNLWIKMCGDKPYMTFSENEVIKVRPANEIDQTKHTDVFLKRSEYKEGVWSIEVQTPTGQLKAQLHIAGEHNVKNALAAITCCIALKIPLSVIEQGLSAFRAVKGRSRSLRLEFGTNQSETLTSQVSEYSKNQPGSQAALVLEVVDDTYNANPDSVIAAINVLSQMKPPTLLVLGDMGEVGSDGPSYHQEVGEYAAQKGITSVFGLGELTKHTIEAFNQHISLVKSEQVGGTHFASMDLLINSLTSIPKTYKSVLVKGSRFMRMEQSVQALEELQASDVNRKVQQSAQQKESTCC